MLGTIVGRSPPMLRAIGGLGPQLLDLFLRLLQHTRRRRLSHELLPVLRGTILQGLAAGSGGHDDLNTACPPNAPADEQLGIIPGAPDNQAARGPIVTVACCFATRARCLALSRAFVRPAAMLSIQLALTWPQKTLARE